MGGILSKIPTLTKEILASLMEIQKSLFLGHLRAKAFTWLFNRVLGWLFRASKQPAKRAGASSSEALGPLSGKLRAVASG